MSRGSQRRVRMAAAALLACLWATAPAAATRPVPDYFPLRLHDSWRYRATQANGSTSEFSLSVVSEDKQSDGSTRRCVELSNPNPLTRDWYTKTKTAVLLQEQEYLGGGGRVALDPPRPLLQQPLRAGSSWTWSGTVRGNVRVEESSEVFQSERIETPAGRFDALKVVTRIEQGGARATKTSWYAAGVGLVRQATESSGVASTTDLIDYSFKPKR
jgi:hypothetical protein